MNIKTLLSAVALSALVGLVDAAVKLTVKCQACTIKKCQSGASTCFRVNDDKGFYNQYCGPCVTGTAFQTEINQCSVETLARTCNTGYCFDYNPTQNYCGDLAEFVMCSATPVMTTTVCGACTTGSCANCLITTTRGMTPKQLCYQYPCSNFTNISYQLSICQDGKQFYGRNCSCCLNSPNTTSYKHRYCTSRAAPFNQMSFSQYDKNRHAAAVFQKYTMVLLLLLMVVFLMLLN